MSPKTARPGADFLLERREILPKGTRIGLVCNPTSLLSDFTHLADAILDDGSLKLAALFGPEHGMFSAAQDMIGVASAKYRGVPVYSLYGDSLESLAPTTQMLHGLDSVVFDIQDVGSRYYTYVWTMTAVMKACAEAGIPFVVCDRPNPLGGNVVQGPVLQPGFESFVGGHNVPIRHGMTPAEIALMVNVENHIGCELSVIRCENWRPWHWFDQTGMNWVMPSPNMPCLETAVVYPGGCLIEGTNLSEGRGTTRPFEIVGAPFLDERKLAAGLNDLDLPGVYFRPIRFEPTFHKFAGQSCGGVFVHVTERDDFSPVETYTALIIQARKLAPEDFRWREKAYEFVRDIPAIDLLYGSDGPRKAIEAGAELGEVAASWEEDAEDFRRRRQPFMQHWKLAEGDPRTKE